MPVSLKKVSITDTTLIPRAAFSNCRSIEEIYICDKVTSIEFSSMLGCNGLKKLTVPFVGIGYNSTGTAHL